MYLLLLFPSVSENLELLSWLSPSYIYLQRLCAFKLKDEAEADLVTYMDTDAGHIIRSTVKFGTVLDHLFLLVLEAGYLVYTCVVLSLLCSAQVTSEGEEQQHKE